MERQRRIELQDERQHVAGGKHTGHERVREHSKIAHCHGVYCRDADRRRPREVIANHPLSTDYNVLALAAPAIAAAAAPGQFVMVKAAASHDPLLRRPFSVFEVFRDARGRPPASRC